MSQLTYEARLLLGAESILAQAEGRAAPARRYERRLQLLEAAAALIGGVRPAEYWGAFGIEPVLSKGDDKEVNDLASALATSGVPTALAASALSREPLTESSRRAAGAYYTDFRLAKHLASSFHGQLRDGMRVLDPASGSGILLLALTTQAFSDGVNPSRWIAESVCAADMSAHALRAARIGFLSLTTDVGALVEMATRWRVHDSLLASSTVWQEFAPEGFDVIVANPPWEKVKLTRHEFLRSTGVARDYGSEYQDIEGTAFDERRRAVASYGEALAGRYLAMRGEPDLYVAFSELLLSLVCPGGEIGLIAPAGLIRSQGTAELRRHILRDAEKIRIEVLENRARFFEIDSRFKFLTLQLRRSASNGGAKHVDLVHSWGQDAEIQSSDAVKIPTDTLARIRPDHSIPEVRSDDEWQIFESLSANGENWSDPVSPWHPRFTREVDMTRDRAAFERFPVRGSVPLAEGRMVHQHRFGVKSYRTGSGRSAVWSANPIGLSRIDPQYWLRLDGLPARLQERVARMRPGFCDITGQTNERSMLAAAVPAGVVCGNKVPTVTFPNDDRPERGWLWISVVNSLPFDWALRRVITTTVNYFLLVSVPLPSISLESMEGHRLIEIAKALHAEDASGPKSTADRQHMAELRAEADVVVLRAYGLSADHLRTMLEDFPLLDRGQPPLPGELRSTVTRDLLLTRALVGRPEGAVHARRLEEALRAGAVAYEASHLVSRDEAEKCLQRYG